MKRSGILLVIAAFVVAAFIQMKVNRVSDAATEKHEEYKIPKKVKAVIDKSCYGCHSENGKSDDAKDALRWDMLGEYDKGKLVSVMDEIIEVIEKEEMPPKKMVEKKPEIKPTEQEYAALMKWAEKEANKLLK
jgi:mono/diheme cytochrome c family protein